MSSQIQVGSKGPDEEGSLMPKPKRRYDADTISFNSLEFEPIRKRDRDRRNGKLAKHRAIEVPITAEMLKKIIARIQEL
jgi:hypothetical protein